MGLDICQHAIVGVKLSVKQLKKVISPAVYAEFTETFDECSSNSEPHPEDLVLVREEKSVYVIGPYEFDEPWRINFKEDNKQVLAVRLLEDDIYIGLDLPIFKAMDIYALGDFLNGSISLMQLESIMVEVKNELYNLGLGDLASKVQLHFFTNIYY